LQVREVASPKISSNCLLQFLSVWKNVPFFITFRLSILISFCLSVLMSFSNYLSLFLNFISCRLSVLMSFRNVFLSLLGMYVPT
jgi:hypothetical protein